MANGTADSALTMRKDAWWVAPLVTGVVLGAFGIYSTWRALANEFYYTEPYLSPFYSPLILSDWWPFPRPYLFSGRRLDFARPAITTEKHTTGHIFSRPRAAGSSRSAKWVLTRGSRVSRSFCRTSTGSFSTRLLSFCCFCGLTRFRPFSSMTGSESASEP